VSGPDPSRPGDPGGQTLIVADAVFPVSAEPLAEGPGSVALLIEGGRIAAIGRRADVRRRSVGPEIVDLTGSAIVPGLVNAHTHLQYSCFGDAISPRDFFGWIRALTSLIPVLDSEGWLASSRLGALENLRAGVTEVGDIFSREESLAAAAEAGLGGVAFFELIGPGADEAARVAASLERRLPHLADSARTAGLALGISPHAPYTSHPSLYVAAKRIADRERLKLATHVAETRMESDLLRDGSGPLASYVTARRDDFVPPRSTPVRYLDGLGFWASGGLAVHAINVTDADRRALARAGATIVTCPSSGEALGSGATDVAAARTAGVRVAVGSDSLASAERINLLTELDALARRHRSLAPGALLEMATRDGAGALGLGPDAGTLTVGGPATLAAFPVATFPAPTAAPGTGGRSGAKRTSGRGPDPSAILRALFAAAPAATAVMRNGRWLVREGRPEGRDEASMRAAAKTATEKLRRAQVAPGDGGARRAKVTPKRRGAR
jgi:cytosine/adenosine deaminase-related metal-dependent hydrolase